MSEPSLLLVPDSKLVRPNGSTTTASTTTAGPPPSGDHYNPLVREVNIPKLANGSCGFDLSRSKWDPYPWVSGIDQTSSTAGQTGLRVGDCVLEVNGEDILGLRIAEVARLVRAKAENVQLLLWTTGMDPRCSPESLCCGPMPLNLDRLSSCVQAILTALECPVCLDTIPPPASQCLNGHLVCSRCRLRAEKCPVCRQRYSSGRSLIAEQVFGAITETFRVRAGEEGDAKLREQLFGPECQRKVVPAVENMKAVQSHTHKFLAKIMGKAASLDGLNRGGGAGRAAAGREGREERTREETAKQLSLSVNEMFRPNCSAPASRSTSPHRLVPDLGSQTFLGTRRPRSHNVSTESLDVLQQQHNDDSHIFRLDIPSHQFQSAPAATEAVLFHCPAGTSACTARLRGAQLADHVGEVHRAAVVSFGDAVAAVVDLPPRQPLDGSCLVLRLHDIRFWVRLHYADGEYVLAALAQASDTEAARYDLEVRVGMAAVGERVVAREIVSHCAVQSLQCRAWHEVLEAHDGIVLSAESIGVTFGDVLATGGIVLKATIRRI